MGALALIGLFIFGLVVFAGGVCAIVDEVKHPLGWFFSILGVGFLVITTFIGAPQEVPVGLPNRNISNGDYKVAFVYVAGGNVNVGIEKPQGSDKESEERLYLYQFPKSAFGNDSINPQAKKLVVVESGAFKKLVLK